MKHRANVGFALSVCTLLITIGGVWDVYWWHEFVGRDNFWIPPHTFAVAGAASGVLLSLFYWYHTRQLQWRNVALAFLVVVLAQPIDNLWHIFFGQEEPSSVAIYWSPPHTLIVIGTVLACIAISRLTKDIEQKILRYISYAFLWGSVFAAIVLLLRPLLPTGTIYNLLGYYGAFPIAAVTVGTLALISRADHVKNSAAIAVCGFAFVHVISAVVAVWMFRYHSEHSCNEILLSALGGKDDIPGLLVWTSYLLTALWLDTQKQSVSTYTVAGFILGATQYSIGSHFLAEQYAFTVVDATVATVSSAVGGVIVGLLFKYFAKK